MHKICLYMFISVYVCLPCMNEREYISMYIIMYVSMHACIGV